MKYIDVPMFVVLVRYTQPSEVVMKHLPAHREFIESQYARGVFIASGRGADLDPAVYRNGPGPSGTGGTGEGRRIPPARGGGLRSRPVACLPRLRRTRPHVSSRPVPRDASNCRGPSTPGETRLPMGGAEARAAFRPLANRGGASALCPPTAMPLPVSPPRSAHDSRRISRIDVVPYCVMRCT